MAAATTSNTWSDDVLRSTSHNSGRKPCPSLSAGKNVRAPLTPTPGAAIRKVSGKRKRGEETPWTTPLTLPGEDTPASMAASPSPLANESYRMADGIDTTPGMTTAAIGAMRIGDSPNFEDYRATWAVRKGHGADQGASVALRAEGNGRAWTTMDSGPANGRRSWTVGGMMGKVFGFCCNMLPALPTDSSTLR